jgi:selenoprotein W-related protein
MADRLLEDFEHNLDGITLIPSTGGVYEVVVDDREVYSKKATGRHAEYVEVGDAVRELIG